MDEHMTPRERVELKDLLQKSIIDLVIFLIGVFFVFVLYQAATP